MRRGVESKNIRRKEKKIDKKKESESRSKIKLESEEGQRSVSTHTLHSFSMILLPILLSSSVRGAVSPHSLSSLVSVLRNARGAFPIFLGVINILYGAPPITKRILANSHIRSNLSTINCAIFRSLFSIR